MAVTFSPRLFCFLSLIVSPGCKLHFLLRRCSAHAAWSQRRYACTSANFLDLHGPLLMLYDVQVQTLLQEEIITNMKFASFRRRLECTGAYDRPKTNLSFEAGKSQ